MPLKLLINGEIVLKTSYSQGRRLTFSTVDGGSYAPVQVEVMDNGRGISEELRDHIFDPLCRVDLGEVVLV